jgi:hypothetical protein
MDSLLTFLSGLDRAGVAYSLGHYTASDVPADLAALTVHVTVSPSERWEVEFFATGEIEVERFRSEGPELTDVDALLGELRA